MLRHISKYICEYYQFYHTKKKNTIKQLHSALKNSNLIVEYGSIRQYPVGLNISFQLSPFYLQLNLYFDFMTKKMATNDQC